MRWRGSEEGRLDEAEVDLVEGRSQARRVACAKYAVER